MLMQRANARTVTQLESQQLFNMLILIILSWGAEKGCAMLLLLLSHTKVTEHKTLRHESVKNENKHMHTLLVGFFTKHTRAHCHLDTN